MTLRNTLIILLGVSLLGLTFIFIKKTINQLSDTGGSPQICNPQEETKMPGTFN
jgi:hypothetical protein